MTKNFSIYYKDNFDFDLYKNKLNLQYVFAASPRTGSTYLSMLMLKTGLLGAPLEYLNFDNSARIIDRLGNGDPVHYWSELKNRRTTPNGVFGFKMFVSNYKNTLNRYPDLISHICGDVVIYLRRSDKISQAVSHLKAIQTISWFSVEKFHNQPIYEFERLYACYKLAFDQEEEWRKIFALTDARVIDLVYEDYILDPQGTVDYIIDEMKLDRSQACKVPDFDLIDKQADRTNQEWYERFKADLARL